MNTEPILPASLCIVITGSTNDGKSYQVLSLLNAQHDDEDLATPTLVIVAEASSYGTLGEVLLDPSRACVWPASDCTEAMAALSACFPDSGAVTFGEAKQRMHAHFTAVAKADKKPPPPAPKSSPRDHIRLRSLVIDTLSTLYKGSVATAQRGLQVEGGASLPTAGAPIAAPRIGKKGASWNDDRMPHAFAARTCGQFIDHINRVAAHCHGVLIVATVHTCPAMETYSTGNEEKVRVVGSAPMLGAVRDLKIGINAAAYSATWMALSAKANIVVHAFRRAPDLSVVSDDDLNSEADANGEAWGGVTYGLITQAAIYKALGAVGWVKRQDSSACYGAFSLMPRYWHEQVPNNTETTLGRYIASPSLGAILEYAVLSFRATTA